MSDYIKRSDALEEISKHCNMSPVWNKVLVLKALDHIPAADVAPVRYGRWEGTADGYADGELVYDMWNCSSCGFDADGAEEVPDWKFCPMCGARMDIRPNPDLEVETDAAD